MLFQLIIQGLAQMKPGDKIHFRFTDQQTAEELFIKQQQHLLQLQNACKFKLEELLINEFRQTNDSSKASPTGGGWGEVDLNCDMGEGIGNDEVIMPFISSANIACGYHAGDEKTMWQTIELAIKHNVAIGAHLSFFDRENFGRTEMNLPANEVYDLVTQQLIITK